MEIPLVYSTWVVLELKPSNLQHCYIFKLGIARCTFSFLLTWAHMTSCKTLGNGI